MAEVISVEEKEKIVKTSIGDLSYDYLVLAMGSTNNYFGFEPVKDKLLPLKSLTDAFNIRSQIMQNPLEQEESVNVAIIGGGPAGLELAGAIAEMTTIPAKVFSSFYALFSGIVFLTTIAIFFAPIAHRILHKFHIEDEDAA